jgi:hypothetical protein
LTINHPGIITAPPYHPVSGNGKGLRQTGYILEFHKSGPEKGKYEAHITVSNDSSQPLKDIQIRVRPYRGSDDPHGNTEMDQAVSEFSPISQFGAWVDVPDLDPGKSAQVSWFFAPKPPYAPDVNGGAIFRYKTPTGEQVQTPDLIAMQAAEAKAKSEAAKRGKLPNPTVR